MNSRARAAVRFQLPGVLAPRAVPLPQLDPVPQLRAVGRPCRRALAGRTMRVRLKARLAGVVVRLAVEFGFDGAAGAVGGGCGRGPAVSRG